jgi:predicted transcriptional regulator of viral defense system
MREEMRTRRGVAKLARAQHGIVAAAQLEALGQSRASMSREVTAGRLHRLHRGVYSVGHRAVPERGRCLAAVLTCGEGTLLSHASAAWLWGLSTTWTTVVEVTTRSPRRRQASIRIHSSTRLYEADRAMVEGIPVTAVPRTLLDFAASRSRSTRHAVQRAERLGLLDVAEVDALLRCNRGSRGAERLREALLAYRDPAFTRSGLERRFLRLVMEAGLPRPSTNLFIAGHELDAYWPAERFAVELDTYTYHGGRRAFEEDRLRQENLKLEGVEMVRMTGARIEREPDLVIARLRKLLAQRRRELGIPAR